MRLDHDEERGPMHGMYGTLDAVLEVQRTPSRERHYQFFLCFLRKAFGPTVVHVEKASLMVCGEEKMKCIGPGAKDADLWILNWEE